MRKTEVVVVLPPVWDWQRPVLGLAYIVAYLKRSGVEVFQYDCNIEFIRSYVGQIRLEEPPYTAIPVVIAKKLHSYTSVPSFLKYANEDKIWTLCNETADMFASKIIERSPRVVGFSIFCNQCLICSAYSQEN